MINSFSCIKFRDYSIDNNPGLPTDDDDDDDYDDDDDDDDYDD